MRALPSFLFAAALLAAPAVVASSGAGVPDTRTAIVVHAANPAGEHLAGALEARLSAALSSRGLPLSDPGALFPWQPSPTQAAPLAQADALFEEGRRAYDELDPDTARRKLTEAAALYAQHPVQTRSETLAQVFIYLGANAMMEGRTERAVDAFQRAAMLAPGVEPDAGIFGPEIAQTWAEAQSSLEARPTSALTLSSIPSGARVFVGGRELGLTPLEPMPLPPGRHHVVISRPGHEPFGEFTELGEVPVLLRPRLEPSPSLAQVHALAAPLMEEQSGPLPEEAKSLAEKLDARWLVLVRVSAEGTLAEPGPARAEALVWDVARGDRLSGLAVELDTADWKGAAELSDRVHDFITRPSAPEAVARSTSSFQTPALLKRWWFWAAVGGTIAAGAGAYAVGQAHGARPDFVVLGVP